MNKSQPNKPTTTRAYSQLLLIDGDAIVVYRDEQLVFRLSVNRCNDQWMYWIGTGMSGFGSQVVIGDARKLSVNPERPADHVLLCFDMMSAQTVSLRLGQTPGAGLAVMVERAGLPAHD